MIYFGVTNFPSRNVCVCSKCGKSWSNEKGMPDRMICPHCGEAEDTESIGTLPSPQSRLINQDIEKAYPVIDVIDGITIHGETIVLYFLFDGKDLKISRQDTRKYRITLAPTPQIMVELNGKSVQPTRENIKRAVAFVSVDNIKDTIFQSLIVVGKEKSRSLAVVLNELLNNPWIEKLYNAGDKKLSLYRLIQESNIKVDCGEPSIIKAINLNRSLFAYLIRNGSVFQKANVRWEVFMVLIKRYGYQVAESILRKAMEIYWMPKMAGNYHGWSFIRRYLELLLKPDVQYNYVRLAEYLSDDIYTYQGIDFADDGAQLLMDYIDMCQMMNVPFEKYPRSLKLVHDIAAKNQKETVDQKMREAFMAIVAEPEYQQLQYSGKDYIVIAPKTPDDMLMEGAALSHCVGSYINKVVNKTAKILFMRRKDKPEKSLVTLDVRKGVLHQAAGYDNRELTPDEQLFVAKWTSRMNLGR